MTSPKYVIYQLLHATLLTSLMMASAADTKHRSKDKTEQLNGVTSQCRPLTPFISCYELVKMADMEVSSDVQTSKKKSKRHGLEDAEKHVQRHLTAFGQSMHLELELNHHILVPGSTNVSVSEVDGIVTHAVEELAVHHYSGRLAGVPRSSVEGFLMDGQFEGVVTTPDETYYVQPASNYAQRLPRATQQDEVIVYRWSDLVLPANYSTSFGSNIPKSDNIRHSSRPKKTSSEVRGHSARKKRSTSVRFRVCELQVVLDHVFMAEVVGLNVHRATGLVATYVAQVGHVFKNTELDEKDTETRFGFKVPDIKTYDFRHKTRYLLHKPEPNDTETYLRYFTNDSHHRNPHCLRVALTNMNFDSVGAAFFALPEVGGICDEETKQNTLMVTRTVDGVLLPELLFMRNLAYVLGQSYGVLCADDELSDCPELMGREKDCVTRDTVHGEFLMNGNMPTNLSKNNWIFSPCSVDQMRPIVAAKGGCFVDEQRELIRCGNGVIDDGERCDCGGVKGCAGVVTCCRSNCRPKYAGTLCRNAGECAAAAHCDGRSDICPTGLAINDGKPCTNGICRGGECTSVETYQQKTDQKPVEASVVKDKPGDQSSVETQIKQKSVVVEATGEKATGIEESVVDDKPRDPSSVVNDTAADPTSVVSDTTADPSSVVNDTAADPSSVVNDTAADPSSVVNDTAADPTSVNKPDMPEAGNQNVEETKNDDKSSDENEDELSVESVVVDPKSKSRTTSAAVRVQRPNTIHFIVCLLITYIALF